MSIGQKIQTLRKKMKLSQEQLAEQCNVTRQAVSKWELDESVPDVDKVILLSRLFNVSTDDILLQESTVLNINQGFFFAEEKINQLIIATTALNLIGMIFSLFYHDRTYDLIFQLAVVWQILSILLFEFLLQRVRLESKISTRRKFYSFNLFIFWVSPSLSLTTIAWSITVVLFEILSFKSIMTVFYISQFLIYGILCVISIIALLLFMKKKEFKTN